MSNEPLEICTISGIKPPSWSSGRPFIFDIKNQPIDEDTKLGRFCDQQSNTFVQPYEIVMLNVEYDHYLYFLPNVFYFPIKLTIYAGALRAKFKAIFSFVREKADFFIDATTLTPMKIQDLKIEIQKLRDRIPQLKDKRYLEEKLQQLKQKHEAEIQQLKQQLESDVKSSESRLLGEEKLIKVLESKVPAQSTTK